MTHNENDKRVLFTSEATLIHSTKVEKIKRAITLNIDSHGCLSFYWLDNFNHEESVFLPVNEQPGLTPSPNYKLKFDSAASEKRYLKALKEARESSK